MDVVDWSGLVSILAMFTQEVFLFLKPCWQQENALLNDPTLFFVFGYDNVCGAVTCRFSEGKKQELKMSHI
jgi:hypothetical protein